MRQPCCQRRQSKDWPLHSARRALQQLRQISLPHCRPRMRPVPMRRVANRYHHKSRARDPPNLPLRDPQLRRIDKIVRRIHIHQPRANFLQPRLRIVIPRSVHRVQQVVRIQARHPCREILVQIFVRRIPRRITLLHQQRRAPRDQQQIQSRTQRLFRLRRVLPALPLRIVPNRVHHHLPPHAIPPRNLYRLARQRHQRVHKLRIRFPPHKRMHAPHRRPQNQPQMLHAQVLQQRMMRRHHVVIVILRKFRVQPVARLRRFPMPNPVRQNDVVLRRIQQLPRAKQFPRKLRLQKLRPRSPSPMQQHHRIRDPPRCVASRFAERSVVQPQLRQSLPIPKPKILNNKLPLRRHGGCHRRGTIYRAPGPWAGLFAAGVLRRGCLTRASVAASLLAAIFRRPPRTTGLIVLSIRHPERSEGPAFRRSTRPYRRAIDRLPGPQARLSRLHPHRRNQKHRQLHRPPSHLFLPLPSPCPLYSKLRALYVKSFSLAPLTSATPYASSPLPPNSAPPAASHAPSGSIPKPIPPPPPPLVGAQYIAPPAFRPESSHLNFGGPDPRYVACHPEAIRLVPSEAEGRG